jgi:hypothetical protein
MESMAQVDTIRDSDVHERSELLPKVRAERKRTPLPKVQFGVLMLGQVCRLHFALFDVCFTDTHGSWPSLSVRHVSYHSSIRFILPYSSPQSFIETPSR